MPEILTQFPVYFWFWGVPCIVLGASGDLAKKKTFPALFGLFKNGFLPSNTRIVGYARTKMDHDQFIERITHYIKPKGCEKSLEEFKSLLSYLPGQYDDDESFIKLDKAIHHCEEERQIEIGKRHRVFYMALPPSVFIPVAKGLKKNAYAKEGLNRIVVEKPFGEDSESSAHLAKELASCFTEEEVRVVVFGEYMGVSSTYLIKTLLVW